MRPRLLVAVVGTATEVGKTFMTAAIAHDLRSQGLAVGARKPVQSHDPADDAPLDADVLAAATGEESAEVCAAHRTLPVAMAPPMAADVLGIARPLLDDLVGEITWPAGVDVGFVETVGGVGSPVAGDGDSADLVRAADVDVVVLIADAGLGTIDAVRTALRFLDQMSVIVVLNRFDERVDLHRRNLDWLRVEDGLDPVVTPAEATNRLLAHLPDRT